MKKGEEIFFRDGSSAFFYKFAQSPSGYVNVMAITEDGSLFMFDPGNEEFYPSSAYLVPQEMRRIVEARGIIETSLKKLQGVWLEAAAELNPHT